MAISVVGSKSAFGSYLRELRRQKGIESPAELSRLMRSQFSVSGILKRERGELRITKKYVDAFIRAVQVSPEEEKALRQHLSLFQIQFDLWKAEKSIFDINAEATERLEESSKIQCFSPTLIPHVLQIADYARGILETYQCSIAQDELEKTVSLREKSAQKIREQPNRNVQLINLESALYNIFGRYETMLRQLKTLLEISEENHIQYGIIPLAAHSNLPTDCTFTIHDGLFVTAESSIGNLYTGDKERAEWSVENFRRLWSAASFGKEREHIIKKAIKAIRGIYDNRHVPNQVGRTAKFVH